MSKDRRSFLKNTVLSGLAVGLSSQVLAGSATNAEKKLAEDLMCKKTTLDYYGEGPFYSDNPPLLSGNKLASDSEPGERIVISGRVLNLDCSEFIPNTVIDVWHANDAGAYDNDEFNLRGYTLTNEQGFYLYETILPGKYLNGSKFRPSHIHYKITPPGFSLLTTQLYFEGDTSIAEDAAASITTGTYDASKRIIPLVVNSGGVKEGVFDIVINGDGIPVGTQDLHINNGMVYSVYPNPSREETIIKYGVFKKAKVGLVVYDLQGKQVAVLEDKVMSPAKYEATWKPDATLAKGHYFVALKINDLQVHYLKIVRH